MQLAITLPDWLNPATPLVFGDDIAAMAAIAGAAMEAGALGFSTSRTLNHRTSDGRRPRP